MSVGLAVKNKVKSAVHVSEKVLPKPVFDTLLRTAFGGYQKMIRGNYIAKGSVLYRNFDAAKWERTRNIHSILPYTLVGVGGLEATHDLCRRILDADVPGDFVELGVARGGCAALMGHALFDDGAADSAAGRALHLFDSYEGLPEPTDDDFRTDGQGTGNHVRPLPLGSCLGTMEEVKDLLFKKKAFPAERIHFYKGWFEDTVPQSGAAIGPIAILRIDGDWYESTKVCLEGLYDQVSSGGAVIVDDYLSCFGCQKAVDEFIETRNLSVVIELDGRGGCYFLKP
jgi:Macrocin-O-methyltransferase (TylF)